ncbi:MAG: hypothetical protein OSJ52_03435, partial [Lachnospiraceae bacterium]|nr:hypothetical protein [Lachnospiraceae bacterium]
IIIRALMYLIQTYHDYLKRTNQNLYGSKKVNLPKPELYVIYTGNRTHIPDTLSLQKDFFDGEKIALEAKIKVLYQEQRKQYGNTKQAVTETIRICKNRDVLKEYLESKEQEVVDMMMTLFDDEQILKAYTKDIEDSRDRVTAERMIKKGKMSLEDIADCVPSLSLEELKELQANIMQLA